MLSGMSNPWLLLQDVLPPATQWPALTRRKFWCSNLNYADRAYLAAFGFLNGVSPELLIEVLQFCNTAATPQKLIKIRDLYSYWSVPGILGVQRRSRYYSYNFYFNFVTDLNGFPRVNIVRNINSNNNPVLRNYNINYHC